MGRKITTGSSATGSLGSLSVTSGTTIQTPLNQNLVLSANGTGTVTTNDPVVLTKNTNSTSTTTGTLVVTGGSGVAGNINIGGNLVVTGGIDNMQLGNVTPANGTFTDVEVTGLATLGEITEVIGLKTGATGVVAHDFLEANTFYHTSVSANFTVNITNLPTTDNRSYSITLHIVQGATAYFINGVQIAGAAQTLRWAGGQAPYPQPNLQETYQLTFVRVSGAWTVYAARSLSGPPQNGSASAQAAPNAAVIKAITGATGSGYYWIQNSQMSTAVQVWCDMDYDGGGYMLVAWGHVANTGDDSGASGNYGIPNLNCNDSSYAYNATSRNGTHGLVTPVGNQTTAVRLFRAAQESIWAAGGTPSTGGIDNYTYVYKVIIPSPTRLTFTNHIVDLTSANTGTETASTPVATVTVRGMKGDVGNVTKYTFRDFLGATWSDSYPTGYGFVNSLSVRGWNSDGGPFFPSVHSGSVPRNNGTGWNAGPDVTNGRRGYTYRGWYRGDSAGSVNNTGQTSIWIR